MEQIFINSTDELEDAAIKFLKLTKGYKKIAFYGEMGVGKTSFIKAICKTLKVIDLVASPSFAIINQYNTHTGQVIYHFDFYRIKKMEEIYDLGFEEYYFSDSYCFIEWPEIAENLYTDDVLKVYIKEKENNIREVKIDI